MLCLHIAHFGFVSTLSYSNIVPLPPQSVLHAALVNVLFRFSPVTATHHLHRATGLTALVMWARNGSRWRCRVARLKVHGGLRTVRNLVLEMWKVLRMVLVRMVVVGWHGMTHVLVLPRLLFYCHRSYSCRRVVINWFKFG